MKSILIISASMNGIPNGESKTNLTYMMRARMKQLKGDINGSSVLSFDLSKDLDEEEQMDLMDAIKISDEMVIFDHQLSSPEILPLIQERLRNHGSIVFFGEDDEPGVKEILEKYPNTRATQYPATMIQMMWEVKAG